MSLEISQTELEQRVLVVFYEHAQKGAERLTAQDIAGRLQSKFGLQRIELALEALANSGLIDGSYSMYDASSYSITNKGYKAVEESYLERLNAAEEAKNSEDPIKSLESKIAPAAGRMVSFGDNLPAKQDAVANVQQAEEIIRSSNSLSVEEKEDTANSLSSWRSLIETTQSFAIGAFKFLVWDRIKSVIEGSIESAYKTLLGGILITLGTIIVSLL